MYWTLELASKLEDAPWPATKDELIDYAMRSGAPLEVIENLQEMEDEGEIYESIEDIWPDIRVKKISFLTKRSIKTTIDRKNTKPGDLLPGFFCVSHCKQKGLTGRSLKRISYFCRNIKLYDL